MAVVKGDEIKRGFNSEEMVFFIEKRTFIRIEKRVKMVVFSEK